MKTDYDVIVIGGGGSGLAAAVSAAERGAKVLLVEKNPQLGGTTGIAIGSFTASDTVLHRHAGIEDTVECHCEDLCRFAPPDLESRGNRPLRQFFLRHAGDTLEWLTRMGVSFCGPFPEPPNRVPRMHNVVPNAKAYIAALQARLIRLGGVLCCETSVTGLLKEGTRIVGVKTLHRGKGTQRYAARGVVLATGDYSNSPELISQYKGAEFADIEGINPTATGEGHLLAREAGAALVNMEVTYGPEIRFVPDRRFNIMQLLPIRGFLAQVMGSLVPWTPSFLLRTIIKRLLVTWQHPDNALLEDGAILVNGRGERFCNERVGPGRETALAAQPEKIGYLLLDQRLIERYSAWPHFISTAPEIAYAYVKDYLRLRPDVAICGSTLASVARHRGIPIGALTETVETFNRYARGTISDPWGRSGDSWPLAGRRWCLLGPVKAYFTTTEGGVAVNERLQALDPSDEPIPGLYAVGQIGLGGQILWGHGLHIAWAMTSGRLAGVNCTSESSSPGAPLVVSAAK